MVLTTKLTEPVPDDAYEPHLGRRDEQSRSNDGAFLQIHGQLKPAGLIYPCATGDGEPDDPDPENVRRWETADQDGCGDADKGEKSCGRGDLLHSIPTAETTATDGRWRILARSTHHATPTRICTGKQREGSLQRFDACVGPGIFGR